MNLTSGFLFSISVCMVVLFWREVVAKRGVFFKLSTWVPSSCFCGFCTYEAYFRQTSYQQASGSAPSFSEERIGGLQAEQSSTTNEEQPFRGMRFL